MTNQYTMTHNAAVEAATTIAKRRGFGVVITRHFDQRAYASENHPGTDMVDSFPVDSRGKRIDWRKAYQLRADTHCWDVVSV